MSGHVRNYVLVLCVVCATWTILICKTYLLVWLNLISIYCVMPMDGWCNVISHFICVLILSYASRIYSHTKAHVCNALGGVHLNMCIGIWGHFEIFMHIFRGSSPISWFTIHALYSSLYEPKLVLSSITKKGEIESASTPLNWFWWFLTITIWDMMLSIRCVQE